MLLVCICRPSQAARAPKGCPMGFGRSDEQKAIRRIEMP